jgi:hypothetical protein
MARKRGEQDFGVAEHRGWSLWSSASSDEMSREGNFQSSTDVWKR